jgi:hypothetical protein
MLLGICLGWIDVGIKIIKRSHFVMEIKDSIIHHKINLFRICLILIVLSGFLFLLSPVLLRQDISRFYLTEFTRLGFYVLSCFSMQFIVSCLIHSIVKRATVSNGVQTALRLTLPLIYLVSVPEENVDSPGFLIANIALTL